jgi:hypothetical protein
MGNHLLGARDVLEVPLHVVSRARAGGRSASRTGTERRNVGRCLLSLDSMPNRNISRKQRTVTRWRDSSIVTLAVHRLEIAGKKLCVTFAVFSLEGVPGSSHLLFKANSGRAAESCDVPAAWFAVDRRMQRWTTPA